MEIRLTVAQRFQTGLLALGVFFYSGAALPFAPLSDSDAAGGSLTNSVLSATLLVGGLVFSVVHWRRCLPLLSKILPFLALLGLAASSALWSQAPEATLRRSTSLLGTILFSISMYAGLGPRHLMKTALVTLLVAAFAGLAIAVVYPAIGLDVGDYANAVRGLYRQKNAFGVALFDAVLILCFLVLRRKKAIITDFLFLAIMLVILVMTRSTTSFLLAVGSFATTIALLWLRRGGAWRATALLGIGSGLALAMIMLALVGTAGVFDLIGKDSTLTGRTEIWDAVWQSIARRPQFGYGYSAFWLPNSREVQFIWNEIDWETPTAHSGYLEVRLQFGSLGMILLVIMLMDSAIRITKGFFGKHLASACWLLLFLISQAIFDRTESGLLSPDLRLVLWIVGILALSERVAHLNSRAARTAVQPVRRREAQALPSKRCA